MKGEDQKTTIVTIRRKQNSTTAIPARPGDIGEIFCECLLIDNTVLQCSGDENKVEMEVWFSPTMKSYPLPYTSALPEVELLNLFLIVRSAER